MKSRRASALALRLHPTERETFGVSLGTGFFGGAPSAFPFCRSGVLETRVPANPAPMGDPEFSSDGLRLFTAEAGIAAFDLAETGLTFAVRNRNVSMGNPRALGDRLYGQEGTLVDQRSLARLATSPLGVSGFLAALDPASQRRFLLEPATATAQSDLTNDRAYGFHRSLTGGSLHQIALACRDLITDQAGTRHYAGTTGRAGFRGNAVAAQRPGPAASHGPATTGD